MAAGQLGRVQWQLQAAAECSRDCSSGGKIWYRTKGGEGSRGEEGGGAFVIIIGHRLTVTGYRQSQLRQQCENWARSNKTLKRNANNMSSSIYEQQGASQWQNVVTAVHGANPRPTTSRPPHGDHKTISRVVDQQPLFTQILPNAASTNLFWLTC